MLPLISTYRLEHVLYELSWVRGGLWRGLLSGPATDSCSELPNIAEQYSIPAAVAVSVCVTSTGATQTSLVRFSTVLADFCSRSLPKLTEA